MIQRDSVIKFWAGFLNNETFTVKSADLWECVVVLVQANKVHVNVVCPV